jgi:hypothetical protein
MSCLKNTIKIYINPLKVELNPICHLLAILGAHLIFHVSRIRVKTAPTCFGAVTPSSGSALFELAKVTVVKIAD